MPRKLLLGLLFLVFAAVAAGWIALNTIDPAALLQTILESERSRAGLTEKITEIDGHQIVYLEGGQGPTVILIHGYNADKDNWTRAAQQLDGGLHLVALDLPGAGRSSRLLESSYDIQAQVRRVKTFVDNLHLAPAYIAGNSMGGHIAALYTATYPQDVKGLILVNAGGVQSKEKSELQIEREKGNHPLIARNAEEFDALMQFVFEKPPWLPDSVKTHFAERTIQNQNFAEKIWADLQREPAPLEEHLPKVRQPVLIIWGEHDRVIHPSAGEVFHELLPNSEHKVLEGIGHVPMLEDPGRFAKELMAFVRKHEP